MKNNEFFEAIVVGSGFGGAIACCRLSQKWPGQVLLLERGKRYPKGSFPRSPKDMAENFWRLPEQKNNRPDFSSEKKLNGLFDVRNYEGMDTVVSAGYGGGSLIYANVFLKPPAWVFRDGWPASVNDETLSPYYDIARSVLGARPAPDATSDPRRTLRRSELFAEFAREDGRISRRADICVFFGKEYTHSSGATPTEIGQQEINRYGATQTSCTYCAECDIGCNVHAKNTLDLNYLYVAEHRHQAVVRTECNVERITPLGPDRQTEDSTQDGTYGYFVRYRTAEGSMAEVRAQRVVVAAGTLSTNELLLRCRDEFGALPRICDQLGKRFSGNGDFVSTAIGGDRPTDSNYGPVITQYIDYDLYEQRGGGSSFLLQDAAYPSFMAWYIEGIRTLSPLNWFWKLKRMMRVATRALLARMSGNWNGSMVSYLYGFLKDDLSSRSSVLLMMGKDRSDGSLSLKDGRINIHWPQTDSRPLYDAMLRCGERFTRFIRGALFMPMPTWLWPIRDNITVHPLGGCALADSAADGVTSAAPGSRGQVFGYQGLYVCDGALIPGSVGANPCATITALAEWICEDITLARPDDTLGVQP